MQKINLLAFVAANKKLEEIMEIDKPIKLSIFSIFTFSLNPLPPLTSTGKPL